MRYLNILTLIFITLKLTGHIDWSWLLVLLPTPISFGLFVLSILFIARFGDLRERMVIYQQYGIKFKI
jgi:hypothetical protein